MCPAGCEAFDALRAELAAANARADKAEAQVAIAVKALGEIDEQWRYDNYDAGEDILSPAAKALAAIAAVKPWRADLRSNRDGTTSVRLRGVEYLLPRGVGLESRNGEDAEAALRRMAAEGTAQVVIAIAAVKP